MNEGVVLLHGIMCPPVFMWPIAKNLQKNNYKTVIISYPSTTQDLTSIAETIHPQIKEFARNKTIIHFVGYSLGGLVVRAYLNKYKLEKLGRIVMLGTPNRGSELADLFKDNWFYKKLFGPAGQQLITDQVNLKEILGDNDYELGIIAGVKKTNFITNKIFKTENDGMVSVANTKIKGMEQQAIVKSGHILLPFKKDTINLALKFIKTGVF